MPTPPFLNKHKKDRHVLEFIEGDDRPIKYKYQCDPATLTPEKLGDGDLYLTAFARRPGLKVTGAPRVAAPRFDPAAWDEAIYLAPGRRIFVCEPPGKGGKPGPLAAALPAKANVVRLSAQAEQWAARFPSRHRNVPRDVIAHEARQAKIKNGVAVIIAPNVTTLESLMLRELTAAASFSTTAARTPGCLLATIAMPIPLPQSRMPLAPPAEAATEAAAFCATS